MICSEGKYYDQDFLGKKLIEIYGLRNKMRSLKETEMYHFQQLAKQLEIPEESKNYVLIEQRVEELLFECKLSEIKNQTPLKEG